MKIAFIVTYIDLEFIDNFIASFKNNSSIDATIIVVSQRSDLSWKLDNPNTKIIYIRLQEIVNSSKARNVAIKYIHNNNKVFDFILFPDDDTVYDASFFSELLQINNSDRCYIMPVFTIEENKIFKVIPFKNGDLIDTNGWKFIGTVNMVIDYKTFMSVGFFDENIGAGSYYGAGEDGDYFIRCCLICGGFIYNDKIYNYHPSPKNTYANLDLKSMIKRFNRYGRGLVYMLCKHEMYINAFLLANKGLLGVFKSILFFRPKLAICYLLSWIERNRILINLYFNKRKQ